MSLCSHAEQKSLVDNNEVKIEEKDLVNFGSTANNNSEVVKVEEIDADFVHIARQPPNLESTCIKDDYNEERYHREIATNARQQISHQDVILPSGQSSKPAEAKSVGSKRNILLLGTARAGKYTIAKNIAADGFKPFPPQKPEKGTGVVNDYEYGNFKFVTVDTAGARTHYRGIYHAKPDITVIKSQIEDHFKHGIHLILIVVRMDCCPPEDIQTLVNIVNSLFTTMARNYIALVHTGCENLEDPERKKYIATFAKNDGPAGILNSFCKKKPLSVGFPDLEKINRNFYQLYNDSVIKGKEELRKLVEDSKCIQPYIELLSTKKSHESNSFTDSDTSACVLM